MEERLNKKKRRWPKVVLIVAVVFLLAFSAVSMIFIKQNFDEMFQRTEEPKYTGYLRYSDVEGKYGRELLTFQSGGVSLQGYLYGAQNRKGVVVISHGMGGGAVSYLAETLYFVDHGYQVFGYDNTGCYQSEGKGGRGLSQSVLDLDAALTYLEGESRFDGLPVFLYGHSWGGYAVTAIFNFDHTIAASASVSGYNKPMDMVLEWVEGMMGGFAYVEYPYLWLYQQMVFGKYAQLTAVEGINRTDTPVLLIHGEADTVISIDGAGIMARRDEITNPNVRYKICSEPQQNGHNNLFRSRSGIEYTEGLNEKYQEIYDRYDGEIPDGIQAEWYEKADKAKSSELDEEFMGDVLRFFEESVR